MLAAIRGHVSWLAQAVVRCCTGAIDAGRLANRLTARLNMIADMGKAHVAGAVLGLQAPAIGTAAAADWLAAIVLLLVPVALVAVMTALLIRRYAIAVLRQIRAVGHALVQRLIAAIATPTEAGSILLTNAIRTVARFANW